MLESLSVSNLWINIEHVQSATMERHIPTKMVSPNINIPWFKQAHRRAARHNRRAYDKAKSANAPGDWEVHGEVRRSLDRSLRNCRSVHLKAIGDKLITNNTKRFWQIIKSLRQSSTGVSPHSSKNGTATSAIAKTDVLSNQFQSVFTKEDCSNLPTYPSNLCYQSKFQLRDL